MNLAIQRFMMPGSSCASWKATGAGTSGVKNQFPAGLRVLVVDDDPTCLMILEKMLKNCNYEATICNRAEIGLSLLREKKNGYDIVLSDVHMPDMDGFKLLEHIGLEMDLPVIMMSADDSNSVVMKGVTHGACDYLIKPVRIEALRNIWQHVVRRRKHEWKDFDPLASADDASQQQKVPEDLDYSSSANDGRDWKNAKRRKDGEDDSEERDESSTLKKPRVVWSIELHQQFVAAVNQLGIDKAVPKKILELMNVPGLTRENVASHLQKYRLYLKRLSGSQLGSININTSFMGCLDSGYGSMSSLNGLDLQAVAGGDQFPGQSLATLQAAVMSHSNNSKSSISVPVIDQRNIFSFENPKSRYGEVKTPHLLHGIPANMEPKQFVGLHQSLQPSFNGPNSQLLVSIGGQNQRQSLLNGNHLPNGMLSYGMGTKASRSEIIPSYNMMNDVNPIRPHDPGFQENNGTFNNASLYSSCKIVRPNVTFSSNKESAADSNGNKNDLMSGKAENLMQFPERYNQDDLLTAILNQPQQEGFGPPGNGFGFVGHTLDDLSV